jgi:hypothetical protein
MNVNVGNTDKALRLIAGIVVLGVGYYYASWWGLIGLVPLGTALSGRCAIYTLLGISTCKVKEKPAKG